MLGIMTNVNLEPFVQFALFSCCKNENFNQARRIFLSSHDPLLTDWHAVLPGMQFWRFIMMTSRVTG